MACKSVELVFLIFLISLTWSYISASFVKLNDTTFASLPPLYDLDNWYKCQEPGDVYCVVDAALVSDTPSPMLELLQEYSKQTAKHYNRTLVHRGVCLSRCGNGTDAVRAQMCLDQALTQYGLKSHVLSVSYCRTAGEEVAAPKSLSVLAVTLLAVVLLATALHSLCSRCDKFDGNRFLLAFSLKQNWAILTYDRNKPRVDDRMKNIACMEGVRFIGIQCVIFSHVIFICIYSYIDNPQFVEGMYDQLGWQTVLNSPLWVQSLFSLSGFLTSYAVFLSHERSPFTLFGCLKGVVNRWIRLTPLAVFVLWFTIEWFPMLGSGPQWSWLVTRESEDCAERWWHHLFYYHNHLPLGKMCMGHTWYLAVDMQLHIIGLPILYLITRHGKTGVALIGGLIAASAVAAGGVTYWYGLTPIITAQAPESVRSLFLGSDVMRLLYLPVWMNAAGYGLGVLAAYTLYYCQRNGIKLNQFKWFNILFHLSLHLGGCVIMSGSLFLRDGARAGLGAALFATLDRTLVALCFAVFMLGCVAQCHSAMRSALEWRGFHVLGRLSYCAFLIHFIVLRLILAANTQLGHANIFSLNTTTIVWQHYYCVLVSVVVVFRNLKQISIITPFERSVIGGQIALLITASVLTYIFSIPLVLIVELPAIQLWKAIVEAPSSVESPRPPQPEVQAPPTPQKSLDLVAHIRRRQEV